MNTWFECKIRFIRQMENGMMKKVTETYLVDALSHAEAEERIIEEMTPFATVEFTVISVKKANYSELFFCPRDLKDRYWYKCKMAFCTIDEKTGVEKRTPTNVLVESDDFRQAIRDLDEGMKGTIADYIILSAAETPIMDVYKYDSKDGEQ